MNCSTGSSSSLERLLNLARSIITFFLTLKKLSNFAKTLSYFFLSSSSILVDTKMSSVSSPRQYNRMLTWHSSDSHNSPDARRVLLKTTFPLQPMVWGVKRKCCQDTQRSVVAGHCSTLNF